MSKNAGVAIWDFLEIEFAPKNCLTEEVYFKNPARCDLYCLYRDIEYDLPLPDTVFDLRFHTGELSVSTTIIRLCMRCLVSLDHGKRILMQK